MADIIKTVPNTNEGAPDTKQIFNGYTLEELRYQRALTALKKDFTQAKMLRSIDSIKAINPLFSKNKSSAMTSKYGSLATKVMAGLSYMDYAKMGFSLFNSGRKIYSFFKKRK